MMKKFNILLALYGAMLLGGCRNETASTNGTASVAGNAPVSTQPVARAMARDDLGREIRLAKAPQRIICIGPGVTEIVYALGQGRRLVARDERSDFPPDAKKLPAVGNFNGPAIESALAMRPDFVIVQGETYGKTRIENWQKQFGVPVASLSATTLDGLRADIEKIAAWLNAEKEAAPLLQKFSALKAASEYSANAPTAFFEVGRAPLWTAGKNTLIHDVMRAAGFRNVAENIEGYKQYGLESLQTKRADFYIVTDAKTDEATRQNILKSLRATAGLRGLDCIQKGRVLVLNADEALRPGPRLLNAIEQLKLMRAKGKI